MRMIQQMTVFLARIMGLKASGDIEEAQKVMNEALELFSGLSEGALLKLSPSDLIKLMGGLDEVNANKYLMFAELLKVKGDLFRSEGDSEKAYELYHKSFKIYNTVLVSSYGTSLKSHCGQLNELVMNLRKYALPFDTQKNIMNYFEMVGEYAKAEDVLYEILKSEINKSDMISEGQAFYKRLLEKSPEELESGGLPLSEVEEGLQLLANKNN